MIIIPEPYTYLDYRQYLREWYTAKKTANRRFSHRGFVRRTGQRSPSLLKDVMERRRNLTPRTAESFCYALRLTDAEGTFFRAIVDFDQAKTAADKTRAWEQITGTKLFRDNQRNEGISMRVLTRWYYVAVRQLALRADFQPDPAWIVDNIAPQITHTQARKALDLLYEVGLPASNPERISA